MDPRDYKSSQMLPTILVVMHVVVLSLPLTPLPPFLLFHPFLILIFRVRYNAARVNHAQVELPSFYWAYCGFRLKWPLFQ